MTDETDGQNTTDETPPQDTPDENEATPRPPWNIPLADIDIADLDTLRKAELEAFCRAEEVADDGTRADMIRRLTAKKHGGNGTQYVAGKMLCRYCGETVGVIGTKTADMEDGRVMVTRQIRCRGRRHHTYVLKTIREPAK